MIENKNDLLADVKDWLEDGFYLDQCIAALEDGEVLEGLSFDDKLSEDDKQVIVEDVYSDLKELKFKNV